MKGPQIMIHVVVSQFMFEQFSSTSNSRLENTLNMMLQLDRVWEERWRWWPDLGRILQHWVEIVQMLVGSIQLWAGPARYWQDQVLPQHRGASSVVIDDEKNFARGNSEGWSKEEHWRGLGERGASIRLSI